MRDLLRRLMSHFEKALIAGLILLPLVLAFNNCARVMSTGLTSSELYTEDYFEKTACEEELYQSFGKTWHPFLVSTCSKCHDQSWGSPSVNLSYRSFMLKTEDAIVSRATNDHSTNHFEDLNKQRISQFRNPWDAAYDKFEFCSSGGHPTDPGTKTDPADSIVLVAKPLNFPVGANEMRMAWSVSSEVGRESDRDRLRSTFSIRIKKILVEGIAVGITTSDPRISKDFSQDSYSLTGLDIKVDGVRSSGFSSYKDLNLTVWGSGTFSVAHSMSQASVPVSVANMGPGSTVAFVLNGFGAPGNPSVPIGTDPSTMSVTLADLMSTDPVKGIFKARCFTCHTGTGSGIAKLNLNDAAQVRAKASTIYSAVYSGVMPASGGALTASQVAIINRWIVLGTP